MIGVKTVTMVLKWAIPVSNGVYGVFGFYNPKSTRNTLFYM